MIIIDGTAVLSGIKTMADGSIRLQIDIGIINPTQLAVLYGEFNNVPCSLMMASQENMDTVKATIAPMLNREEEWVYREPEE
jgi:hypothetical protein